MHMHATPYDDMFRRHSYAKHCLWRSVDGRRVCEGIFLGTTVDS